MKKELSSDVRVCQKCGSSKGMRIVDISARGDHKWVHRRRKCQFCGNAIGTYEINVDELKQIRTENNEMKKGLVKMAEMVKKYGLNAEEEE